MTWKDVYHVPNVGSVSLLSETVLDEKDSEIETRIGIKEILKNEEVMFRAETRRNTFVQLLEVIRPDDKGMTAKTMSLECWHQRLGHVSDKVIQTMKDNERVTGMSVSLKTKTLRRLSSRKENKR